MKNSKKGHIEHIEEAHRKQARIVICITLCACAIVVLHEHPYSFCGWQLHVYIGVFSSVV